MPICIFLTGRPWPSSASAVRGHASLTEPEGQRASRSSWPKLRAPPRGIVPAAAGVEVMTASASRRLSADVIMMVVPDQTPEGGLRDRHSRTTSTEGDMLMVRPWVQYPLQPDRPAAQRRRDDDRSQRPRAPGAPRVHRGWGSAALIAVYQDATGKARDKALAYAAGIGALRAGVIRDYFQRRDRDRPLRRAGCPLRWRERADPGRVRDSGAMHG